MKVWNDEAQGYFNTESEASWAQATNITEENSEIEMEKGKITAEWVNKIGKCAISYFRELTNICEVWMERLGLRDINGA